MSNTGAVPILFCTKCGSSTPANAQFCNNCGTPLPVASTIAVPPTAYSSNYGGFFARFVAFVIDAVVVGVLSAPVVIMLVGGVIPQIIANQNREPDPALVFAMLSRFALVAILVLAIRWLYEAYLLSSERQATVGKMALGLKVTDLGGRRISFGRATGRHFAKILSHMILLIGYLMALFTERKQALHDIIAGTLVIKA